MPRGYRYLSLIVFILSWISAPCSSISAARAHESYSGDLVGSLEFISVTYRLPMVIELNSQYPTYAYVPSGAHSAKELLRQVLAPFPQIQCTWRNGVALVLDRTVADANFNFFNATMDQFVLPVDVAELRLSLNSRMHNPHGRRAGVMAGILEPGLQKLKLNRGKELTNVTGREVLVQVSQETQNLFSVAIINRPPLSRKNTGGAKGGRGEVSWALRSIDELPGNPTRMRSFAPKGAYKGKE